MDALKVEIVLLCMDHFVTGRVLDALKRILMSVHDALDTHLSCF